MKSILEDVAITATIDAWICHTWYCFPMHYSNLGLRCTCRVIDQIKWTRKQHTLLTPLYGNNIICTAYSMKFTFEMYSSPVECQYKWTETESNWW